MPYLNLDDNFPDHPDVDELTDAEFRSLVRDICSWSKTGSTENEYVLHLLDQKMLRRAPRHWIPDALLPPPKRYRRKIPFEVRKQVLARDGWACLHCSSLGDLTLDHIVPWSQGGSDGAENLQTLCRPCNSRKGARL